MENRSRIEVEEAIGVDLGDKYSQYCWMGSEGEVVLEGRVRTTPKGFQKVFGKHKPIRIAIEVGTHSPWVRRVLEELGHEVIVANARKLRLIYENESKDDRVDAEYLARLARLDPKLLSPIQHRGEQTRADLALLRARDSLVRSRTLLVNHVRGCVKSFGARLPKCSTGSFARRAQEGIPENLRGVLDRLLQTIQELTDKIKECEKEVQRTSQERYPQTELVRQVAGVGPVTALAFVLVIEDPARFRKSRSVGSYLGLRPKRRNSGKQEPQLRITKAGDPFLRTLLVKSAQYILGPFGPDTDLRRWGLKLASRGGKNAKKRAVVAVARQLAVLLLRLWKSGETYEPLRNSGKRPERKRA